MPCFTSPEEYRAMEQEENKRKYGVAWTDYQKVGAIACWLARDSGVDANDPNLPPYVRVWVVEHRERDKEEVDRIAAMKRRETLIQRVADAKSAQMQLQLSPEDLELINVK